ncbi:MAG: VOC family protein [Fimbriimonadaceae bacterium]|nr:MAG: VOC family protein [Fimbriimonadaceae bacterium]
MIGRVNVVFCFVTDMPRAVSFYRSLMETEPAFESSHWTEFFAGGLRVALHLSSPESTAKSGPTGWVPCFECDDLRLLRERVEAAGVRFEREFHDTPSGAILAFADPDGNPLQAIQLGVQAKDLA